MTDTSTQQRARGIGAKALSVLRPLIPKRFRRDQPVVPVVRLTGVIGFGTPLRPGLTLASVARTLDRAFSMRNAPAVALAINSPGGSPAQSHLIFRRIRELAEEKGRRVIAFIEDAAASGGYMIACAGDEIIADPHSIVGSIGVVGGTFGFDKLIAKSASSAGSIRRASTRRCSIRSCRRIRIRSSGQKMQRDIHESFIALVKLRRGAKLVGPESALFSGEYWSGARGLEMGLVDGIGDLRTVCASVLATRLSTPLVTADRGLLGRRLAGVTAGDRRAGHRPSSALPKRSFPRSRRVLFGPATDCRA